MLRVTPEGDSFYKLEGLPSPAANWLKYDVPQEYRYYDFVDNQGYWYVHRDYVIGAVEVSYSHQGMVDYSSLPVDLQIEIARAKENWRVYSNNGRSLTPKKDTLETSYSALHLLPSAPMSVVQAVWHALAKEAHPDKGGDPELFKRYSEAYHAIRKDNT